MLKRRSPLAAVPALALALALALSLALAGPALADQAAPEAPAANAPADSPSQAVAANPGQRAVNGRALLTPDERRTLRREFMQATPEQQLLIWQRVHSQLEQRAAQRRAVLAEPASRPGGNVGARRDAGAREDGGARFVLFIVRVPRAP